MLFMPVFLWYWEPYLWLELSNVQHFPAWSERTMFVDIEEIAKLREGQGKRAWRRFWWLRLDVD
ncbi:hypothetical protein D3C86_2107660 [compost metagenome]